MSKFRVYEKIREESITVNIGFNWWAFLFPGPWALFNGLILAGSLGIAIPMSALFLDVDGAIFAALLSFVLMCVYGFKGNDWLCSKLEKDGFTIANTKGPATKLLHSLDDRFTGLKRLLSLKTKGSYHKRNLKN